MSENFHHISVLPNEVLHYLNPQADERFIDCTLGGGGHSGLVLQSSPNVQLLGLDQDANALAAATEKLSEFGGRFSSKRMNFGDLRDLQGGEWDQVDGILMDIGVSSHQIDSAERGFSYMKDGPLDMRMDNRQDVTAATLLNEADEAELSRIFWVYGEEKEARRIAKAVVNDREEKPWERTREFAELVTRVVGRKKKGNAPAPAKCFQALRIAVNRELEVLEQGLEAAFDLLKPGGRLVIISFHSLEDRMVKQFFKEKEVSCICPPEFPVCCCNKKQEVKVLSRKAVKPGKDEIAHNSRSSCSRLRAAQKLC